MATAVATDAFGNAYITGTHLASGSSQWEMFVRKVSLYQKGPPYAPLAHGMCFRRLVVFCRRIRGICFRRIRRTGPD